MRYSERFKNLYKVKAEEFDIHDILLGKAITKYSKLPKKKRDIKEDSKTAKQSEKKEVVSDQKIDTEDIFVEDEYKKVNRKSSTWTIEETK